MSNSIIEIKNLKKSYGSNEVLKDISLSVNKGEVISIIGSSGSENQPSCARSIFLEEPSAGQILFHGEDVLAEHYNLTHYREKLGMVFQSFNLFEKPKCIGKCYRRSNHRPQKRPCTSRTNR
ncbi:ATP-binding cassette domain-containing protein [Streptococcus pyogenes]|uniref:ATP-binding cassette domain-containing protein n=1 Tax=Streptococcus pyogenes TaxID=1314 RepID=UPI000DFF0F8B|nr:amino acid ABC transporter ATP-binding protein [Streptococcus pyogenes]